ncbi:secretory carrier-associated membrane protein 1-like isoform X3 [Petromyzon marinus]|uniref:Secretory carrier-associated membrane protein n=1 Tax=Petromyzon marinus TaxID=7757 RepID=A0AAJ7T0E3_PETMA|nr:secretory carrier-associated membrane protein 1-like isoform X1 [Petromyzon marinus]
MAQIDENPFADPVLNHPFQDPAVTQVTDSSNRGLTEYNPFASDDFGRQIGSTVPVGPAGAPPLASQTQPAVMQPTEEPPTFPAQLPSQQMGSAITADLKRQQEELERKAAELDRREHEMQGHNYNARKNNWPPLPAKCPVGPCFYQDFAIDIPLDFQRTVRILYYMWMFHFITLFLNVLGCLAWFIVNASKGVDFGLSIVWFIVFTPCSFVCWYRPVYKACRSDSSFNFFLFFFIFFAQFVVHVLQAVGIPGWGNCGWISTIGAFSSNIAVGVILSIIAIMFTASAALSLIMLKRVHSMYRRTGASFEKAQQEFAQGVFTNRTVQNTAANAAAASLRDPM